ncbi:hypothetical protein LIPSTDRAFT_108321 [Lipomyces starkeyi NRRL Y-11557]|uniref:Uncharacterized protein n=1 Tax=Lipomyces starkeyi NRRL Y-11557 TaxID=675824 RepID=A0A1E3PVF7_LIPST|nr:hypothetical protein LIPSTDRAFT_108321 [Lipomyces starkeyi NRRL Y-11557]
MWKDKTGGVLVQQYNLPKQARVDVRTYEPALYLHSNSPTPNGTIAQLICPFLRRISKLKDYP